MSLWALSQVGISNECPKKEEETKRNLNPRTLREKEIIYRKIRWAKKKVLKQTPFCSAFVLQWGGRKIKIQKRLLTLFPYRAATWLASFPILGGCLHLEVCRNKIHYYSIKVTLMLFILVSRRWGWGEVGGNLFLPVENYYNLTTLKGL